MLLPMARRTLRPAPEVQTGNDIIAQLILVRIKNLPTCQPSAVSLSIQNKPELDEPL